VTVASPGLSIGADTARLKLTLDYSPSLVMHAIEGSLNAVTQQLNLTGLVTVAPDFAYVDIRALSGVQSRLGAVAGAGTVGAAATGVTGTETGQGLNRDNEVQTSSFGLSPYVIRQFGDYGNGKIGVSANASRYSTISGFVGNPLPTGGGTGGQTLLSTEEIAHFTTGQFLNKIQGSIDIDVSQSNSVTDAATTTTGTTSTTVPATSTRSQRQSLNNQLSYALSHNFTLLASAGVQKIQYTGQNQPNISGLTWNAGFTYTPGPDSSLTITYGRQNGTNAFNANGHFAIGGRTLLTMSYANTVGTQLENLQNQLNASTINVNGQLVSAITGGPNFGAQNATGVQTGVFRFDTFNTSLSTQWERDTFQATATWSIQTSLTPGSVQTTEFIDPATGNLVAFTQPTSGSGQSTDTKTASLTWTHLLSPDTTLSSSASYSLTRRPSGQGTDGALTTAISLQYSLSASTTLTGRYSFFDRVSKIPGYSIYENILLLGVTKQF